MHSLTDDELLKLAYFTRARDPLVQELCKRLEESNDEKEALGSELQSCQPN